MHIVQKKLVGVVLPVYIHLLDFFFPESNKWL